MVLKAGPSPESLAELRATVLAMKLMGKTLRSEVNKATREQGNEIFRGLINTRAGTKLDQAVLAKGARVAAGNPPRLIAASSKRAVRGGTLVPDRTGRSFEFGTKDQEAFKTYERKSRNGGTHTVTRRTRRQLPSFQQSGRVIFPAVADAMPRLVSLWVQLVARKTLDAFEGKSSS
jgi:hypothetical protein